LDHAVDVVLGTDQVDLVNIHKLASQLDPPAEIRIAPNGLTTLVAEADLAIGAAGVSALERCCLGLPSIVVTIAENQCMLAAELARRGAVANIGSLREVTTQRIVDALHALAASTPRRCAMSKAAMRITDGLGSSRIALDCQPAPIANDGGTVRLRPASLADATPMLEWQSMPGIRSYSRNPKAPEPQEHQQWLKRKLEDPNCIFNIVLHRDRPTGVMRFDQLGENLYEISILIAAEAQNLGVGQAALELGKLLLPNAAIRAVISARNVASIRMFERAGYRRVDDAWVFTPRIHEPSRDD